jgi:transketolase
MAVAEAWLAARYNRPGHKIIDHYTYAICGDGDLMEGVSQEAASLAGHLHLGKLIYLYDQNHISLAGATEIDFTEDVAKRFEAHGWHTRSVADGNDTAEFESIVSGKLPQNWDVDLPKWKPTDKPIATRAAGGEIINAIAKHIPNLLGGSADLNPSTRTALKGLGDFQSPEVSGPGTLGAVGGEWSYAGRNIAFGVREHAMGAAVNGMAAHGGILPFSATFFTFSDYMKPAIRLGALSNLKAIYVFTHDSIGLGEDGPTHQPVEQLAGLRGIPGLTVIRPADPNETAEAWAFAVEHDGPSLLVLTRQTVAHLDRSGAKDPGVAHGAYVLADAEGGSPDVILIGTGSEVGLCGLAREKLKNFGVKARVVSMPSWNLFEAQEDSYRESVLPRGIKKRVTVEAASPIGWHRWAGDEGTVIGLKRFGASAPGQEVLDHLGFTADHVASAALRLLGKNVEADQEYASKATSGRG